VEGGSDKIYRLYLSRQSLGLLRDISSIDSTGQECVISNVQLGATTVINLYINPELCRILPDFPLSVFAFLSEMHFIEIGFLPAKLYGNNE